MQRNIDLHRFNAKEQDEETGLYYCGARYYNPQTSIWLSIDPLASMYPHLTPYNFVENNPIMLIDPTGMSSEDPHEWNLNIETGETEKVSELGGDDVHFVNIINNKGNQLGQFSVDPPSSENIDNLSGTSNILPVAKSIGIDIDFMVGIGHDFSPISIGIVFQGQDKWETFTFGDFGGLDEYGESWAFGLDLSGSIEETNYWYTGDIENFRIETFNGKRTEVNIGGSYGIDLGIGVSASDPDAYGGRLIGVKAFIGVGWSPFVISGNINRGKTIVY